MTIFYTLASRLKGDVDGEVVISAFRYLNVLLELNEMFVDDFHQALKSNILSGMVVIRPDLELKSTSLFDEEVLNDTNEEMSARCVPST